MSVKEQIWTTYPYLFKQEAIWDRTATRKHMAVCLIWEMWKVVGSHKIAGMKWLEEIENDIIIFKN